MFNLATVGIALLLVGLPSQPATGIEDVLSTGKTCRSTFVDLSPQVQVPAAPSAVALLLDDVSYRGAGIKVSRGRYRITDEKGNDIILEHTCISTCGSCGIDGCDHTQTGCTGCTCSGSGCSGCECTKESMEIE